MSEEQAKAKKERKPLDELGTMRRLETLTLALTPSARYRAVNWLQERIAESSATMTVALRGGERWEGPELPQLEA